MHASDAQLLLHFLHEHLSAYRKRLRPTLLALSAVVQRHRRPSVEARLDGLPSQGTRTMGIDLDRRRLIPSVLGRAFALLALVVLLGGTTGNELHAVGN